MCAHINTRVFKDVINTVLNLQSKLVMFAYFLASWFYCLCHKCMPSNCFLEGVWQCNSLACDKSGQLLLLSFTFATAFKNTLECLTNGLIKYEGLQFITVFHRLHLTLSF